MDTWLTALKQFEMERENIQRLKQVAIQGITYDYDQDRRIHQTLRASSGLTAVEMATQLQALPEQWNPLHDLLRTERASRLSVELDAAKHQYEQSRLSADPLGLKRISVLQAGHEQLKRLTNSATLNIIREIEERYNIVRSYTELPSLAAIADLTIHAIKTGYIDPYFTQTFAGSILDSLSPLQGYRGYEEFGTKLDRIERLFEERIRSNPHGIISFDGILGIFVDVILFILGLIISNQSDKLFLSELDNTRSSIERHMDEKRESIINELREFKNNVFTEIDGLKPKKEEYKIFYVATRTVNVRSDPSKNSCAIGRIGQNNKVGLIASKENWLYIKYFDFIDGIPKMGWVYAEYMKRLPEEGK
jgi:hypothetical protein